MAEPIKIGNYNVDLSNITDEARRKQVIGELNAYTADATKAGTINPGGLGKSVTADEMIQQNIKSYGGILSPYSSDKVVDGSADIRNNINNIDDKLNGVGTGEPDLSFGLSEKELEDMKRMKEMEKGLGILTAQDTADIEAEAAAAGMKYDPLISEATEEKRKGMPKAVISAGERGGFMSTQMSGTAALTQTNGGNFVGAGGELENIKSVYDTNIKNLEVAKLRAIEEARSAAKQYKLTGKREDLKAAQDNFKFYQDANQKAVDLATSKVNAVSTWTKLQNDKIVSKLPSIYENLTGDETADKKFIEEYALKNGIDKDTMASNLISYEKDLQDTALTQLSKKISIAKTIPKGTTYTDPDSGIKIVGTEDPEILDTVQTVGNNEFKVRYDLSDPKNPKEMFRINLGAKYKDTGGGADTDSTPAEAVTELVEYLHNLKQKGQFTDFNYKTGLNSYLDQYGSGDPTEYAMLQNDVNKRLEAYDKGETLTKEYNENKNTNPTNNNSDIENIILRYQQGGNLNRGDIRSILLKSYSLDEVNNSSVGNIIDKTAAFVNKNWLN